MWEERAVEVIAAQGAWAILAVALVVWTVKSSHEREKLNREANAKTLKEVMDFAERREKELCVILEKTSAVLYGDIEEIKSCLKEAGCDIKEVKAELFRERR